MTRRKLTRMYPDQETADAVFEGLSKTDAGALLLSMVEHIEEGGDQDHEGQALDFYRLPTSRAEGVVIEVNGERYDVTTRKMSQVI